MESNTPYYIFQLHNKITCLSNTHGPLSSKRHVWMHMPFRTILTFIMPTAVYIWTFAIKANCNLVYATSLLPLKKYANLSDRKYYAVRISLKICDPRFISAVQNHCAINEASQSEVSQSGGRREELTTDFTVNGLFAFATGRPWNRGTLVMKILW